MENTQQDGIDRPKTIQKLTTTFSYGGLEKVDDVVRSRLGIVQGYSVFLSKLCMMDSQKASSLTCFELLTIGMTAPSDFLEPKTYSANI